MNIYCAIHTALKAHDKQVRKLDNDLYIAHPLEVGLELAKHGFSDALIIAGLLHDTLEDTPLTQTEIEELFGEEVARYVDFCSERNKTDSWKTRKINYIEHLKNAPLEVLYIVCVDKLTNIKSIYRNLETQGSIIWHKFNAGYEDQKWYYHAILDLLKPIESHPLYEQLNTYVQKIFHPESL